MRQNESWAPRRGDSESAIRSQIRPYLGVPDPRESSAPRSDHCDADSCANAFFLRKSSMRGLLYIRKWVLLKPNLEISYLSIAGIQTDISS